MSERATIMPDLTGGSRGLRHTANSALRTLRRMGLARRVVLEAAGPGSIPGTIVQQSPAAGTALTPTTVIHLKVAGVGGFHNLPFALRTVSRTVLDPRNGDALGLRRTVGVDRVLASIDDQVLKAVHSIRHAGGYLDLQPARREVARRYLRDIFGVDPDQWSEERWYPLARVLRDVHRLAGTRAGIITAFAEVFALAVASVELAQRTVPFPPERRTRLGEHASRLGIDAVAGEGIRAEARLIITFEVAGPADVRIHRAPAAARERRQLYALLLPAHLHAQHVVEKWRVGRGDVRARLGDRDGFAYLDLGARLAAAPAGAST